MANKVKVKTPHGIVIIYNYQERFGDKYINQDPFFIDQIILNSASLISIQTQKNKGAPAGTFEIKLAPYKNWTSAITPGSWCIILMSNSPVDDAAKTGKGTVNEMSFKMLGRIESVRGVVSVNPVTGATSKQYIVTGSDWGCVFNSSLYVDPLDRDPDATAMGMAQRFGYGEYLSQTLNWKQGVTKDSSKKDPTPVDKKTVSILSGKANIAPDEARKKVDSAASTNVQKAKNDQAAAEQNQQKLQQNKALDLKVSRAPTSSENVKILLQLWGKAPSGYLNTNQATNGQLLGDAQQQFKIPEELRKYMGLSSQNITDLLLNNNSGIGTLIGPDTYSGKDESVGIIHFDSIFGEHAMWDVLMQNVNSLTSELISEVRFEKGVPKLTLYNRIKPFVINKNRMVQDAYQIEGGVAKENAKSSNESKSSKVKSILNEITSEFKNVKCIDIDSNDVMLSSFGTNWRDKVNFVEVGIDRSLMFGETHAASLKLDSQFYDKRSISRDGLRARREFTGYVPVSRSNGQSAFADPMGAFAYKYLLKEWYFNTHTMLNGTLSLVGQDKYIQVGDNIRVDAKVLDINRNFNKDQNSKKGSFYLLAHVESISHNIAYHGDHRVFTTSINFVRGILVDKNNNSINELNSGALDQDASLLSPGREVNSRMSGSSSSVDPDSEKLGFIKADSDRVNSIREDDDEKN